jgi:hypothetical protein
MNKFYDYLMPDMSLPAIGALVRYIRRFTAAMGGDIPVEGRMGRYGFCAAGDSQQVRVYWVQVGRGDLRHRTRRAAHRLGLRWGR